MNQLNAYVLGIYQLAMIVRDTLEYTLKKESYNVEIYEQRRKGLEALLLDNAPLPIFVRNNGEKAEPILANLKKFQEEFYSDTATIVQLSHNEVRVDHNQHLVIYEQVVGIYQTLVDVVAGYMNYARANKLEDEDIIELYHLDERYFRLYSHYVIVDDLMAAFKEFNQVMKENNGEPGPLSNFVVEDMKKLNGFLQFEKQHNKITDTKYNELIDQVFAFVENMEGKRALPEGKSFPYVHKQILEELRGELGPAEKAWQDQYHKVMLAAVEASKQAQEVLKQTEVKKEDLS